MSVLVLSDADVVELLTPTLAIESQRVAFQAVVNGRGRLSGAVRAVDTDTEELAFMLMGMMSESTGLVGKFGWQRPDEHARKVLHGLVVVFDPGNGVPVALLNAASFTTLRTSAALAVAADVLAPTTATRLAVLGAGVQAAATVRMIAAVRRLDSVAVWSPTPERRERLAARLSTELDLDVCAVATPRDAVRDREVIAICTSSHTPVVRGEWLHDGQTIVTMGSYEPGRREVDLDATRRASTFVDELSKCRTQCGPLVEAVRAGVIAEADVIELGEVIVGRRPGRQSADHIVIFHSLGIGYQDTAAGWAVYEKAVEHRVGISVPF